MLVSERAKCDQQKNKHITRKGKGIRERGQMKKHIVIFLYESNEIVSRVVLENVYFKTKQTAEYIINIRHTKKYIIYETTVGVYSIWTNHMVEDDLIGFDCDKIYIDKFFTSNKEFINKVKQCFKEDVPTTIQLIDISKYNFLTTK